MLILNSKEVDVPGLDSVNWTQDPKCPRTTDVSVRRTWIHGIVIHTVHGKRGVLKPGYKESKRDLTYAQYQAHTSRDVSWDYTVDTDASVAVSNDPGTHYTWHAGSVNPITIGIELIQDDDGALYEDQFTYGLIPLLHALCDEFAIQKQVPARAGSPISGVVQRLAGPDLGRDVVGVYGHRNQTHNRGFGDPGDHVFAALLADGFEGFDFDAGEDKRVWKSRQLSLGIPMSEADGVVGPKTIAALKAAGYKNGVWVNGKV